LSADQQFLSIKNWSKFQPKLKNGKDRRDWIRVDTRLEDDWEFSQLTCFERELLTSIWRVRGRTGNNIPNDPMYIARAICAVGTDRPHIGHALATLISRGFLILSNQQNDIESATQDKTGQDRTIQPPNPLRGKAPKKQEPFSYSPAFEQVWNPYPRKIGKGAAFKAFQKCGLNGDVSVLLKSIEEHKAQWTDPQYIPHLATFLNRRQWEDQLTPIQLVQQRKTDFQLIDEWQPEEKHDK